MNVLAIVFFFYTVAMLVGIAGLALIGPGLVRQPIRVIWEMS